MQFISQALHPRAGGGVSCLVCSDSAAGAFMMFFSNNQQGVRKGSQMTLYKTILSLGLGAVIAAFGAHAESRMQRFYNEAMSRQVVASNHDSPPARIYAPMGALVWADEAFLDSKIELGGIEKKVSEDKSLPVLHPADLNGDWRLVMSEAILSLSGWQHGSVPISEAVRAAYLWQNGEQYAYDSSASAPLCWVLKSSDYYNPSLIRQITQRVIENPDYPEVSGSHPCAIWVPDASAVSAYKNGVFVPSRLVSEGRATASLSDVVDTTSTYGYKSSTKPPRFIPMIDYSSYGEDPLFSFIGQMIPGTNVQYTDPAIPPVWLVDTKDVDGDGTLDTIPALTTIDFTIFKSINWPRERYMSAIEKARTGTEVIDYERLSGQIPDYNKTFSGIIKVTGDVLHAQGGGGSVTVQPGSIFVMNAGAINNDNPIWSGIPDNFSGPTINLWDSIILNGSEQKPIIWTSNAQNPAGNDWVGIFTGNISSLTEQNNLIEYSRRGFQLSSVNNPTIQDNIIRHTEGDYGSSIHFSNGIMIDKSCIIKNNELYNNSVGIYPFGFNQCITNNNIFNNLIVDIASANTKGIFTGSNLQQTIFNNILTDCDWGIASEDGSTNNINIHHNISSLNTIGVMMYWAVDPNPVPYSNPLLKNNNVWHNKAPLYVIGATDGIANYVKGNEGIGHTVTHEYDSQNTSNNPNFRNISIYDLVHDTDNDSLFSDVESNSGTYTSPTDTGTDPWNPDSDDDGLLDGVETGTGIYNGPGDTGSDPNNWDTNGNGYSDGDEVRWGHDPSAVDDFRLPLSTTVSLTAVGGLLALLSLYRLHRQKDNACSR